jgi:hypothetical protein
MSTKGEEIRFKKGTFGGQTGWINVARGNQGFTPVKVHVIVGTGPKKGTHTMVMQSSIGKKQPHQEPTSFAQAVYQEHGWVEHLMELLAAKIACLDIDCNELVEIGDLFTAKLLEAEAAQKNKGNKGKYYKSDAKKEKFHHKRG